MTRKKKIYTLFFIIFSYSHTHICGRASDFPNFPILHRKHIYIIQLCTCMCRIYIQAEAYVGEFKEMKCENFHYDERKQMEKSNEFSTVLHVFVYNNIVFREKSV